MRSPGINDIIREGAESLFLLRSRPAGFLQAIKFRRAREMQKMQLRNAAELINFAKEAGVTA